MSLGDIRVYCGKANRNCAFTPTADAYVDASDPTTNFGTLTQLRTDGSPVQRSYLRFTISGITQTITSATLMVYANSSTSQSVTASRVADNSWTETGITYNSAPAVGSAINSAGPVTSGTWLSIDVTPYILQNTTYSLVLTTNGSTGINFSSREDTAHPPQLVLQFGNVATTFGACPERSRRVGTYWELTLPNANAVKYYYPSAGSGQALGLSGWRCEAQARRSTTCTPIRSTRSA